MLEGAILETDIATVACIYSRFRAYNPRLVLKSCLVIKSLNRELVGIEHTKAALKSDITFEIRTKPSGMLEVDVLNGEMLKRCLIASLYIY